MRTSVPSLALAVFLILSSAGAAAAEPLAFKPGDTLEEIRYKIDYNGYSFTVGHNRIFDMTPAEKAAFFARRFPRAPRSRAVSDDLGPLARQLGRTALPSSFDWRSYNGHSYIGAVRDQGDCGSCYSFGACGAAEGTYNFANGLYGSNCIDFSESYIIWCLGRLSQYEEHFYGCNGADWDYMELEALTRQGIILESAFPYRESDPGSCTHWSDHTYAFQSWHRITCNDTNAIKTAIMTYGPVDASVDVDTGFEAYDSGVYQNTSTTCPPDPEIGSECYHTYTNHAISLVGWDDSPPEGGGGVWILRNSWGDTWGESGYMRIRYGSARSSCEVCYLVYGQAAPATSAYVVIDSGDYDGTFGLTDVAVFRSYYGLWSVRNVSRLSFGSSGDLPASGDFNGDGTTDITTFRPAGGLWAVRNLTRFYFGQSSDASVPGDYDGDGTCDAGIFRAATGYWSIRNVTSAYLGSSGDYPAPAYFGYPYDQKRIAAFRPSSGLWVIKDLTRFTFGQSGDRPVPGDYDSSGPMEAAVFRSSYGMWAVKDLTRIYFGGSSDAPVPGDYAADSNFGDDIAVFKPSSGVWAVRNLTRLYFGTSGDIPATR